MPNPTDSGVAVVQGEIAERDVGTVVYAANSSLLGGGEDDGLLFACLFLPCR
ncbi:hypothetical protein [Streptomyces shenzhenensis]|uniref:hypothetical protein n=1 Tax=Streptomyces shenzhenensis TaxID=943815 RepID=UPI0015F08908|nr:hypothetical protein [Streptomyces shenzhenensis]